MDIKQVAGLLGYSPEQVKGLIEQGISLSGSGERFKLECTDISGKPDVSDEQFDALMEKLDDKQPGRWPPADVRRELLVEARHRCSICRQAAPPQFHHTLDWAKINHHDAKHMLMLCGTCHDRCTRGEIDYKSQVRYKRGLQNNDSSTAANASGEIKKSRDLAVLRELFLLLPRKLIERLLELAALDRIHVDHIECADAAENMFNSTLFHLYDSKLRELLEKFFLHWNGAWDVGRLSHHDHQHRGIATLILQETDPPSRWEDHKLYMTHVIQARSAMAEINRHVHEAFPEFDLKESDDRAEYDYWRAYELAEKRAAEIWGETEQA